MSAVDIAIYGMIAVVVGIVIVWFLFYTFSGQTNLPSNLTEDTLKRLIGTTGRATSAITEQTGTVLVNSEEYSASTKTGTIQKGTHVRVIDTNAVKLIVELG